MEYNLEDRNNAVLALLGVKMVAEEAFLIVGVAPLAVLRFARDADSVHDEIS